MRVLVTGAFGFLGAGVTQRLIESGHEVVLLTSRQAGSVQPSQPAVAVISGDVRDAQGLRRLLAGTEVDAVCHLAALTRVRESFERPDDYFAVNRDGTRNVVDAVRASANDGRPVRFVLASTGAVYGAPELQPIAESTGLNPSNPYGRSKAAAEKAVLSIPADGSFGVVVLRCFSLAGAVGGHTDGDLTRIIPKALAVARGDASTLQVNGDGTAVRDFVHVDDAARAFLTALDYAEPDRRSVFNVGATGASVAEIIKVVEEVTGEAICTEHLPPKPEPQLLVADTTLIRTELGWKASRSSLVEIVSDAWDAVRPQP